MCCYYSAILEFNHASLQLLQVDQLKAQGNKAFSSGDFKEAINFFTQAIDQDPTNHVLFSNRSAAYASLKEFDKALEDAEKTVELKKDWGKGYSRKGAALFGLGKHQEARKCYEEGLEVDPNNATLKKGIEDVENAMMSSINDPFKKVLNNDVWGKIAGNPQLSGYLVQPDYMEKMKQLVANPSLINMYMQDQRIMTTLLVLMGINIKGADDVFGKDQQDEAEPSKPAASSPKKPSSPKKEATPAPEPEPMEVEKTEEELKREEALKEKELGNAAYKKKDFETAIKHYDKAWELSEEKEVSVLTNKAAVMFEMKNYEECIKLCEKAVEVGREIRADFKLIARAYGRMGNSFFQMNDFDSAITYFNKSLTEHRTPDILTKLRETEKLKAQKEKEAYHSPELSDQARERGNQLFKEQKYADAVKEYEEAIKRNENDAKNYSNRAACFHKLGAIPDALKDCETAIKLDPNFVKAYIRKAAIEFFKKDYSKCLETCELAKKADTEGKHTGEIDSQMQKCMFALNMQIGSEGGREEAAKQAMQDPEIQAILGDPVMQQILSQMQSDPGAVRDHMKNPVIAAKIRKLIASGILATR
ncbi:stress-induced-phosphoprotein 1-like protein [Paraphysoderma sedebokerense]|nr:stress-induced-phosphoprotein 1-like protein [Paraphysoderma sedebokerense]